MAVEGSEENTSPAPPLHCDDISSVAFSSRVSAAFRAVEQQQREPLFRDEFAHLLAGPTAMEYVGEWDPGHVHVTARVAFIDKFVESQLLKEDNGLQIVMVGCGMETRSFRLNHLSERDTIFELDVGEVVDLKGRIVGEIEPAPVCRAVLKRVKVLLVEDESPWMKSIVEAGFDARKKSVWLTDGLLFFLNEAIVERLVGDISKLSSAGSVLCTDVMTRSFEENGYSGKKYDYLSLFQSHIPDPEAFLRKHSFDLMSCDRVGGDTISFKKWGDCKVNDGHFVVTARKEGVNCVDGVARL